MLNIQILGDKIINNFSNLKLNLINMDPKNIGIQDHDQENNYKYNHNNNELRLELVDTHGLIALLNYLKTEPDIYCEQLMDLCAVDYLHYGVTDLNTTTMNNHGCARAINDEYLLYPEQQFNMYKNCRFAIVYQLLSITNNIRISLKCLLTIANDQQLLAVANHQAGLLKDINNDAKFLVPSCVAIWPIANWYEREIFDMFGIEFIDHPNLSRILTEDNCNGHPLRKDFPLIGKYEISFDGKQQAVVPQPITDPEPYIVAPKVIRKIMHNCEIED